MIVAGDFNRERDRQTFEFLRCGHIEEPAETKKPLRRTG
jgi:hypothetical protein